MAFCASNAEPGTCVRLPVSVKAVVGRDGCVVLLRNEREEWELPGGKLEADESPEECVVREVGEETGWHVALRALLDVWVYEPVPDRPVFVVTYAAVPVSERALVVSDEHKELRLVPIPEVEMLQMPEGYKRSIRSWATLSR
jgi:8-oxo-dGTP pyrophosphatase MutT (NUDIX family)